MDPFSQTVTLNVLVLVTSTVAGATTYMKALGKAEAKYIAMTWENASKTIIVYMRMKM
jgi:hypothetical protein